MPLKFCVFCGEPPTEKTREHVIPLWLIKHTGDPNRTVRLGMDWSSGDFKERRYSWNSFAFPACKSCNDRWSGLEGKVKPIIIKLLNNSPLAADDFYVFLDWIDKVRTGLWLAMMFLNRNHLEVKPKFHIDKRVAQKDRALLIYEADDGAQGIRLGGFDTPIFHLAPSVCFISVNQFYFVSISSDFYLAKPLGWPYPKMKKFVDAQSEGVQILLGGGTKRTSYSPVINPLPRLRGTVLLQPIASQTIREQDHARFVEEFCTDFVTSRCIDPVNCVGRLLLGNRKPIPYPSNPSQNWRPRKANARTSLDIELINWTFQMQKRLYLDQPDYSHFPEADRIQRFKQINAAVRLQEVLIKKISETAFS